MSDTWAASRTSINRLKAALQEADGDTRIDFVLWAIGLGLMAIAIISQFGWAGLLFCAGAIVWKTSDHALRS